MFLINRKFIADPEKFFQNVADCVKTPVSVCIHDGLFLSVADRCLRHDPVILLEMALADMEIRSMVHVILLKDLINPLRRQFLMFLI